MGLLDGLYRKSTALEKEFSIIPEDKRWVDVCFKWLLKNYGFLAKGSVPFLLTEKDFPATYKAKKVTIDNLLSDLCRLMLIDKSLISYEVLTDIRDSPQTDFEIEGRMFESDIEIKTEGYDSPHYLIYIANDVVRKELVLLRRIVLELAKIKLIDKKPDYKNANLTYFAYIASVYFGFGVLISKALVEVGRERKGRKQRIWRNSAEVPYQLVSYAIANYAKLLGNENPVWINEMPADERKEFLKAMDFLDKNPDENTFLSEKEFENLLNAQKFWERALELSRSKKYAEAIELYKLSISTSSDKDILSLAYLNCGYAYLMLEKYDESLPYYFKALEVRPNFSYAYANMGYIYTMIGQLDKAKEYLDKVDAYDKTLEAYLLRDWALYHLQTGNKQLAEEDFKKAFDTGTPVDLLEYFYAKYLFSKSENEEAMRYLDISISKGERQGIKLMSTLKK